MAKQTTPAVDQAAIKAVKWTDPKMRDRFFRDIGHTANAAGVWATITHAGFAYVAACEASQTKPDSEAVFAAYAAGRALDGGPGVLSTSSLPTYKSAITGVVEVAAALPANYGAETLRDFIATECGKTGFSQRGGYIRAIFAAHPEKCGTPEEMEACSPEVDRNVSQALQTLVTGLINVGKNDSFAGDLIAHGLGAPYQTALAAVKALADGSAKVIPLPAKGNGAKKKKGQSEATRALGL
jgi:hypothetical protein